MPSKKNYPWPDTYRLKEKWEFDTVFRTNKRFNGRLVRLFCCHADTEFSQFGFAVGKKIAGAVGRARGRRVLRECARRIAPITVGGFLIVVIMTPHGLTAQTADIYREFAELMNRGRLLKEKPPAFTDAC